MSTLIIYAENVIAVIRTLKHRFGYRTVTNPAQYHLPLAVVTYVPRYLHQFEQQSRLKERFRKFIAADVVLSYLFFDFVTKHLRIIKSSKSLMMSVNEHRVPQFFLTFFDENEFLKKF